MKVFLDTCIYTSYSFSNDAIFKNIINDLKSSKEKEQTVLLSVEEEFYNLHYKISTKVLLKVVKLVRNNNKDEFWEKLDELSKEKNGQIFGILQGIYGEDLFTNRRTLLYKRFQLSCKLLLHDYNTNTYNCERYWNIPESAVQNELNWVQANFCEFINPVNSSDAQHLAGAIKYEHTNKIFVSEDKIFKKFEIDTRYQQQIIIKNLEVLAPNSYSQTYITPT